MNKIPLIIKREYLTRVKKKSFVIMSIIGPLLLAALMIVPIWLATMEGKKRLINVIDESGFFTGNLENSSTLDFNFIQDDILTAKKNLAAGEAYGILYIPDIKIESPEGITFFCEKNPSIEVISNIESMIQSKIEDFRLKQSAISKEFLDSLKTPVSINTINVTETGEKAGNAGIATAVGYISSLLIYFFILFYGVQVLRGVIEEKTSRIVEIIVSSVRPFQLMAGKIIGIGAVGLTQFLIWIILSFGISSLIGIFLGSGAAITPDNPMAGTPQDRAILDEIFGSMESLNFPLIIFTFVFYFLGSYLLYGALFAAIGSAVDNETDGQQFQLPVTIPLIASIIVLAAVLKEPDGSLAFWMSVIPFTSPVVMMMRIPFGVPAWELILSMILLVGGFIFTTWIASRIYRIGILMYGTKINYRILGKWLFMKN